MSVSEWIRSNGWPLRMIETVAVKYYNENSFQSITHSDMSVLANEVNSIDFKIDWSQVYVKICRQISNLNIHEQLIIIDSEETVLTVAFLLGLN